MKIDLNKKVRVKNMTTNRVGTIAPSYNFRSRVWETPDAMHWVEIGEIEDVMQTYGGKSIYTESLKVYASVEELEHLGLESDVELDTTDESLSKLFALDTVAFYNRVAKYPNDSRPSLVEYAVKTEINDFDKLQILLELTGIDAAYEISRNRKNKGSMIDKIENQPSQVTSKSGVQIKYK